MQTESYYYAVTKIPLHSKSQTLFEYSVKFENENDIKDITSIITEGTSEYGIIAMWPILSAGFKANGIEHSYKICGNINSVHYWMARLIIPFYQKLYKWNGEVKYKNSINYIEN